ncbi:MAG: hypothetical protein EHM42_12365 [Planctomycetaceae bacterium]|nr:MAG: hypothetical protein EHM42_12365 [Planctomycetaceae bacterium]
MPVVATLRLAQCRRSNRQLNSLWFWRRSKSKVQLSCGCRVRQNAGSSGGDPHSGV